MYVFIVFVLWDPGEAQSHICVPTLLVQLNDDKALIGWLIELSLPSFPADKEQYETECSYFTPKYDIVLNLSKYCWCLYLTKPQLCNCLTMLITVKKSQLYLFLFWKSNQMLHITVHIIAVFAAEPFVYKTDTRGVGWSIKIWFRDQDAVSDELGVRTCYDPHKIKNQNKIQVNDSHCEAGWTDIRNEWSQDPVRRRSDCWLSISGNCRNTYDWADLLLYAHIFFPPMCLYRFLFSLSATCFWVPTEKKKPCSLINI